MTAMWVPPIPTQKETDLVFEGNDITAAEAVIDNGRFGKRTIRFETGLLAKQAAGSAMAYLDGETAILSATTVGKHPKDQFDFFPPVSYTHLTLPTILLV